MILCFSHNAYEKNRGLSGWFVLGTGFAIILGIMFALEFVTIHGGAAWIEHYVLRWYLWRAGYLPWKVIAFLDSATEHILLQKIGGGYMFTHRLFLEYFASLSHKTREQETQEGEPRSDPSEKEQATLSSEAEQHVLR